MKRCRAKYYFQFGPQWHLDSYDSIQCDQSEGRIQINRCGQSESLWNWIWMWMFSDVGCCYLCFVFCSVYSHGHCKNMVRLFNRLCAYIRIKINSIFKHQVATVVNIKFMPRRVPRVWMPETLVALVFKHGVNLTPTSFFFGTAQLQSFSLPFLNRTSFYTG